MKNRASKSIAWTGAVVALIAGVIFCAIQIYFDFQHQVQSNDKLIQNALQIASAGAAQATYEGNAPEANAVLQSLMVYGCITESKILTESGETLTSRNRQPPPQFADSEITGVMGVFKRYELDLYHQHGQLNVGKLQVSVHNATAMQTFLSRAAKELIIGVVWSLVLSALLICVFNTMLTRPLGRFINSLRSVDLHDPKPVDIPPRFVASQDEFTELATSTNSILEASQQHLIETERQRREARTASEQLHHSERLSVIGKLTGGISHDFNNVLTVVFNCLELLRSEKNLNDEAKQLIDTGLKATENGVNLTTQLVSFLRQQPLTPKPLQFNSLAPNLNTLLTRALGSRYDVEVLPANDLWPCMTDARQLETAILNLAIDARSAMPDGGKLSIVATNVEAAQLESSVSAEGPTTNHYVNITVTDNGTAMSQETIRSLLEPNTPIDKTDEDSRAGLSMANNFIKRCGGRVHVHSTKDEGTSIQLLLPRFVKPSTERHTDKLKLSSGHTNPA